MGGGMVGAPVAPAAPKGGGMPMAPMPQGMPPQGMPPQGMQQPSQQQNPNAIIQNVVRILQQTGDTSPQSVARAVQQAGGDQNTFAQIMQMIGGGQ
jgi:hypothetical protein